ncbi:unnamed protein product [Cyprideis torosa]|uniref:Uncharacterized protein n=1 Tax=Cyprideis torosa TaxID=163714 RepID=A0A7R8W5K9_9CRUS|nr:unnamed protein product [Cyprideis torosa]CAG0885416.1 unnamed protein product [Cyprideis torosa]
MEDDKAFQDMVALFPSIVMDNSDNFVTDSLPEGEIFVHQFMVIEKNPNIYFPNMTLRAVIVLFLSLGFVLPLAVILLYRTIRFKIFTIWKMICSLIGITADSRTPKITLNDLLNAPEKPVPLTAAEKEEAKERLKHYRELYKLREHFRRKPKVNLFRNELGSRIKK